MAGPWKVLIVAIAWMVPAALVVYTREAAIAWSFILSAIFSATVINR